MQCPDGLCDSSSTIEYVVLHTSILVSRASIRSIAPRPQQQRHMIVLLPLLRREPQLNLWPKRLILPKVRSGIKRQFPDHLVVVVQFGLYASDQLVEVRVRGPGRDSAIVVCPGGPVGRCGICWVDEFELDFDVGGWFAGDGVEDVAGYEGALRGHCGMGMGGERAAYGVRTTVLCSL